MFFNNLLRLFSLLTLVLSVLLLAGCQFDNGGQAPVPAFRLTPSTTPDNLGYTSVPSPACLVADWSSMQTDKLQGDLLAWSPDGTRLAYLAPQPSSSWYVGLASVAQGAGYTERAALVPNIMAVGDLTWSQDGTRIAFVALRTNENLQTVLVAHADGSTLTDLFPFDEARSDLRSSQKAIIGWSDTSHLRVQTSCGEDCQQELEINILTGAARPSSDSERRNAMKTPTPGVIKVLDGLEPYINQQSYDPKVFPRTFNQPNWSPDGQMVLYLDRRGLLWNLNPDNKAQYLLDLGLRFVNETKWSPDGLQVAVRAEDRIFVFDLACHGSPLP
jgi:hypothetical protein